MFAFARRFYSLPSTQIVISPARVSAKNHLNAPVTSTAGSSVFMMKCESRTTTRTPPLLSNSSPSSLLHDPLACVTNPRFWSVPSLDPLPFAVKSSMGPGRIVTVPGKYYYSQSTLRTSYAQAKISMTLVRIGAISIA